MRAALLALWLAATASLQEGPQRSPRQFVTDFHRRHPHSLYTVIPLHISEDGDGGGERVAKLLNFGFHARRLVADESVVIRHVEKRIRESGLGEKAFTGVATICNSNGGHSDTGAEIDVLLTEMVCIDYKRALLAKGTVTGTPFPPPFAVNMSPHSRSLPALKSCSWPEERLSIERQRDILSKSKALPYGINDTVLIREARGTALLEGLTSSLLLLSHDMQSGATELSLAVEGSALRGSMSDVVATAAASLGYSVNYNGALLSQLAAPDNGCSAVIRGAFLCSATKVAQRIDVIYDASGDIVYNKLRLRSNEMINEKIDFLHYKTLEYICDNGDVAWRTVHL